MRIYYGARAGRRGPKAESAGAQMHMHSDLCMRTAHTQVLDMMLQTIKISYYKLMLRVRLKITFNLTRGPQQYIVIRQTDGGTRDTYFFVGKTNLLSTSPGSRSLFPTRVGPRSRYF